MPGSIPPLLSADVPRSITNVQISPFMAEIVVTDKDFFFMPQGMMDELRRFDTWGDITVRTYRDIENYTTKIFVVALNPRAIRFIAPIMFGLNRWLTERRRNAPVKDPYL